MSISPFPLCEILVMTLSKCQLAYFWKVASVLAEQTVCVCVCRTYLFNQSLKFYDNSKIMANPSGEVNKNF